MVLDDLQDNLNGNTPRIGNETRLTDTALPRISLNLISFIRSSTPIASGRSFLFAMTSKGTDAKAGKESRACNSDVAVGSDFVCLSARFKGLRIISLHPQRPPRIYR